MNRPRTLTLTALAGIPQVSKGDDLAGIILDGLARTGLEPGTADAIVLAQKIVSKAEGRRVFLSSVAPSPRATQIAAIVQKDPRLVELILSESTEVLRMRPGVLIVQHRLGFVLANAGIDQSNIDQSEDSALLLPRDPDATCAALRTAIKAQCGTDIAVAIVDSIGRAWRMGTVGQAIGVSGMAGLLDLRGELDMFGRTLRASELGLADELAAAASLIMGQASEGTPIVAVSGLPYARREGAAKELVRPRDMDLFR
jgi:coenzyme F420-0:L-glutamate ligase / coenzyme F420-1:gamma-L-glutamate ligase